MTSGADVEDDNGIKELAMKMREVVNVMKDMNKQQLNVFNFMKKL